MPVAAGGRAYLVERGLEQVGNSALKVLVADYLAQAAQYGTIPARVPADRYLTHLQ